ncbi:MAG: (d)CMP kinase [Gammaproteobacteria bacterium]
MTGNIPVITIDGPSGSGKGTIAAAVANRMGYHLLDSGALYRVLGVVAHRAGIVLEDAAQLTRLAAEMTVEFGRSSPDSVHVNGADLTLDIRGSLGSDLSSRVGAVPEARAALLQRQLAFRQAPGLVADGRDMGTVVFPDAEVKIFLTASLEKRAERRYKQLIGKGIDAILPDLLRDLKERDTRDSKRKVSPLIPAQDATIIDSTDLEIDQVLDQVMTLVHARLGE